MSINAITNAWTPPEVKATDLSDTDSAKEQAENAHKAPPSPEGDTARTSETVESKNPMGYHIPWTDVDVDGIGERWKEANIFGRILASFGTNSGLNNIQRDNRLIAQQQAQYTNTTVAESLFTFA